MSYDLGDTVPLAATVRDITGALANATTATLTITLPDLTTSVEVVGPTSTGLYEYDYSSVQAGRHTASWVMTGANSGAFTDSFDVWPLEAGIISLADAKLTVNSSPTVTTDDEEMRVFIQGITDFVEWYCGPVLQKTVSEQIRGGSVFFALDRTPVISLVSIVKVLTVGFDYDITQLVVDPYTGIVRHNAGLPFIYGPYTVTYKVGRPIIPKSITLAARMIFQHLWRTQRGGQLTTMAADDATSFYGFGFAVPNRALEMLAPHRNSGGAA